MSSNIKVQRNCQYCGVEFTARTTVTKCCSTVCAQRAYKARKSAEKIESSNMEIQRVKTRPIEELKAKEFLSVREVSKLIGCSRQNVYYLINSGQLKASNILKKKTIVKRSDLEMLFEGSKTKTTQSEIVKYDISDCYNLTEIKNKFGVSDKTIQELIKRNNIPKIKKGWYAYVPKTVINRLLS
ncbi:helix-turn-helix domain-containing protein [Bacteroidota bacterium]